MCFNGWMSAGFASVGAFGSWWIHSKTSNTQLAVGVFFFFLMEALQAVQYMFLASGLDDPVCQTTINKVLTMAGYIHICLQPYFCHLINEALSQEPSPKNTPEHNKKLENYRSQYRVIKRLCLIGGFLIWLRYPLAVLFPSLDTLGASEKSTEWLRGNKLCTFKEQSMVHLGWSVPMASPTYNIMGVGLHSFLMFAPFFAMYEKRGMVLQGIVLYVTGPLAASYISKNLMEQASIWCFFSIAQISIMLFLIREVLIVNWGREGQVSLTGKDKTDKATRNTVAAAAKVIEATGNGNGNGHGKKKSN
jgi:hypothetical protein